MTQRITIYTFISEEYDDLEDVEGDLEEYDDNNNNSGIVEELELDTSAAREFVIQFKRCIETASQNPNILLSQSHTITNHNHSHNSNEEGKLEDNKEEEDEKEYNFTQQQYEEIVTDIIKYSTDLGDLIFFDDNAQNLLRMISRIQPNRFLDLHSVLTRNIMMEYIKYPHKECNTIINKAMYVFLRNLYFKDKKHNEKALDIGYLMRRFLPHQPLLHILINGNSDLCNKVTAKEGNLKFIQYLQLITCLQGLPSMMKIFHQQEGSNGNVINFDLCMIFHKKIWNGMNKKLIKKNSNNFVVKTKKINKKKQQYWDTNLIYNHCFHDLLINLQKLVKDTSFNNDCITIYVNCTKHLDNKYPELIIAFKDTKIDCRYDLSIHYAVLSRRRYTADVEDAKKWLGYKPNSSGNNDIVKTVESGLMMHSFVIKPRGNKANSEVIQWLNYGFGVMRFFKKDIYDILPHCFVCKSKDDFVTYTQLHNYDGTSKDVDILRNESFDRINERFLESRANNNNHRKSPSQSSTRY